MCKGHWQWSDAQFAYTFAGTSASAKRWFGSLCKKEWGIHTFRLIIVPQCYYLYWLPGQPVNLMKFEILLSIFVAFWLYLTVVYLFSIYISIYIHHCDGNKIKPLDFKDYIHNQPIYEQEVKDNRKNMIFLIVLGSPMELSEDAVS